MKAIVFKIFLFCFLAGAGQYLFANAFEAGKGTTASFELTKQRQQKSINHKDHSLTLVDDSEFDLEEDLSSGDHFQDISSKPSLICHPVVIQQWYALVSSVLFSDYSLKDSQNLQPFLGYTLPIYLQHRVLRI